MWCIEKFEPVEVPESEHGKLSSGDCYVVLYTYGPTKSDHIVYMWQGATAGQDERGACAHAAVRIDEEHCGGAAPQVRPSPEFGPLRRASLSIEVLLSTLWALHDSRCTSRLARVAECA